MSCELLMSCPCRKSGQILFGFHQAIATFLCVKNIFMRSTQTMLTLLLLCCSPTSSCRRTSASRSLAACTTSPCAPSTFPAPLRASQGCAKLSIRNAATTQHGVMGAAILTHKALRSSWLCSSLRYTPSCLSSGSVLSWPRP